MTAAPALHLLVLELHAQTMVALRMAHRQAQVAGVPMRVGVYHAGSRPLSSREKEQLAEVQAYLRQHHLRMLDTEGEGIYTLARLREQWLQAAADMPDRPILLKLVVRQPGRWHIASRHALLGLAEQLSAPFTIQVIMLGAEPWRVGFWQRKPWRGIRVMDVFWAWVAVFCAFLVTELLRAYTPRIAFQLNQQNVAIIFLIACVFIAGRFGLFPGLVASVSSFLLINYLYMLPTYAFHFDHMGDILNMALFLAAALLVSLFNSHTRAHAAASAAKERRTRLLYRLQRLWSEATHRQDAIQRLCRAMEEELDVETVFYLPNPDQPERLEAVGEGVVEQKARTQLIRAWENLQTTGAGTKGGAAAGWRFIPMLTNEQEIGVLAIRVSREPLRDADFLRLIHAIAEQAALLLERMELTGRMQESHIREEREKLRAMLLSSVSHDLKTPLASIIGGLRLHSSLLQRGQLDAATAEDLLQTAVQEAERLEQFIHNILEMTRLESGEIHFRQEWHNPAESVLQVRARLASRLERHRLHLDLPKRPLQVKMDVQMTEQVMQNLLDNAAKYAPEGSIIRLRLDRDATTGSMVCEVEDEGNGVPDSQKSRIFDKYARLDREDKQVAGTGLGLAICKAIVEAQGGTINVQDGQTGGALFRFTLPECEDAPMHRIGAAEESL